MITELTISDLQRRYRLDAANAMKLQADLIAERGDSLMVHVPDATRGDLIAALATMPDEAFGWLVLACQPKAMVKGGLTQIWPDGMGGFSSESRASVEAVRKAAAAFQESR